MRSVRPSGFFGGVGVGLLLALFAFGDLARIAVLIAPASAQSAFAPAFRIMDGAHTQLATVDHTGRLLVSTGSTSGLTDHITSVTHVTGSMRILSSTPNNQAAFVTHSGALAVTCYTNAGVAETCGGSGGSGDAVNVFHQSTIAHISSVTHIYGRVSLVSQAGGYVTLTGTSLDVNCTGCSAASTVAVSHISTALHVAGTIQGARFHVEGVGSPGQSHGGVLSVQGVSGMNPVVGRIVGAPNVGLGVLVTHTGQLGVTCFTNAGVSETCGGTGSGDAVNVFHQSTIRHISSVTHIAGGIFLTNQAGVAVTTTSNALDVNCTGCSSSATVHISAALHIAGTLNGGRVHITGLGTPGQTHGGVVTVQGVTGMIGMSVYQDTPRWTVAHVTSVTHIYGTVSLVNRAGTYASFTSTSLDVNCTAGCAGSGDTVNVFHQSTIRHISSAVHVVGFSGAALHMQGIGLPGAAHGGVVSVQGIGGMVALSVAQSVANWTTAHVTSVTHVYGTVSLVNRAGTYASFTSTSLDVNCTAGCGSGDVVNVFHQSTIRHISSVVHIAGYAGAALHMQGIGLPGAAHGGVLSVQGVGGMVAISVSQSSATWTVAHITSVAHVYGTVSLVNRAGTYASFTSTSLDVNCTAGCGSGDAVNVFHQSTIRHISSVTHIAGGIFLTNLAGTAVTVTGTALDVNCTGCSAASVVAVTHVSSALHIAGTIKGAQFHITGLGLPGQTHGGVFTIQGVTGMIGVAVFQDAPRWTIAHVTSVTHVGGTILLVNQAGTPINWGGGTPGLSVTTTASSTVGQSGVWNITHLSGQLHVRLIPNTKDLIAVHITSGGDGCTTCKARVDHYNNLVVQSHISGALRAWRVVNCGSTAALAINTNANRRDLILANAGDRPLYIGYGTTGHVALTAANGFPLHALGYTSANAVQGENHSASYFYLPNYAGPLACIAPAATALSVMEILR